jgi:small subunit ribosomal protein S20
VPLLDPLGFPGISILIDSGELLRRGIERFALGHCSILFAARLAGLFMANIASQKKRIARTERERQENLRFRSSVKTHFRRLEAAVAAGNADQAATEHKALTSRIDKAVQRGALHRNTGARKKSRAAALVSGSTPATAAPEAAAEQPAEEQS